MTVPPATSLGYPKSLLVWAPAHSGLWETGSMFPLCPTVSSELSSLQWPGAIETNPSEAPTLAIEPLVAAAGLRLDAG